MKTNHAARRIVKVRHVVSLLAVIGLVCFEVGLAGSLASRFNQTDSPRSATEQAAGVWNVAMTIPNLAMLAR